MPTKKQLKQQADDLGLDVKSSATKDELKAALDSRHVPQPSAGVEGRSLDEDTDLPNAAQTDEGTFTKEYVILGDFDQDDEERMGDYERNVRQQAQQVGLRTTGDVTLESQEQHSDGVSTRVRFTVPVLSASVPAEQLLPEEVGAVVSNDEADEIEEVKDVPNA